MSYAEDLLEGLTTVSTIAMNVESRARLGVLLTDFIVVARAGKIAHGKSTSSERNLGAQLAINSSFHDADDIDWSVITHPGSVIWASLLESIVLNPQYASRFTLAARIERSGMLRRLPAHWHRQQPHLFSATSLKLNMLLHLEVAPQIWVV